MSDLTERLRANESNYFMGHLFTQAADRIDELETALRDTVEWLDRTDRDGCAHTEHARRALGDDDAGK